MPAICKAQHRVIRVGFHQVPEWRVGGKPEHGTGLEGLDHHPSFALGSRNKDVFPLARCLVEILDLDHGARDGVAFEVDAVNSKDAVLLNSAAVCYD